MLCKILLSKAKAYCIITGKKINNIEDTDKILLNWRQLSKQTPPVR